MPDPAPAALEAPSQPWALSARSRAVAASLIAVVTAASLYFFYFRGLTNIYGDALAHMEGARRLFDSLTPGYAEIGSVWLPLYHVLVAPLAINDFLWRSGLAGSLASSAALAGTAWFLFRLAAEINGNAAAGFLSLAALLLSPNFLYLGSTPLTEPLALFWAVLAVYALFRYRESGCLKPLLAGAAAAFCGTLTRYDEWYVLPFAAVFVLFARREPWPTRFRRAVLFSLIAGAGPVLWFLHNAIRFGNPLEFYNGPFSARAIYAHQLATTAFPYPTDGSLRLSAHYYFEDVKLVIGAWPVELAVLGMITWIVNRREWGRRAVALLFLVPLPFYIQAMAYAAIPLYVPTLFPHTYYNLRYGLEMIPAVALLPAFLLSTGLPIRLRTTLLAIFVGMLFAQGIALVWNGPRELMVVKEGLLNSPCRSKLQQAIVRVLRDRYDGRRILMAAGKWPCVIPAVGIDYRNTLTEENRKYWAQVRSDPARWVEWIIRGEGDSVDELMRARPDAFKDYVIVATDSAPREGSATIYRRRGGP